MAKRITISVLVTLFVFAAVNFLKKKRNESSIKNNMVIRLAKVYEVRGVGKPGKPNVYYSYSFENSTYHGEQVLNGFFIKDAINNINGKFFPVAIDSLKRSNSWLLVSPDHFKKMGITFPDSLKWILKYYSEDFIDF
jgi:hypothetical protein